MLQTLQSRSSECAHAKTVTATKAGVSDGSGLSGNQASQKNFHAAHVKVEGCLCEGFEHSLVVDLSADLKQMYWDIRAPVSMAGVEEI